MPVELRIEQIQAQLQKLREQHGDSVYEQARLDIALSIILKPNGEEFCKNAFPDLDPEELKAEATKREAALPDGSTTPEQVMLRLLQQQVPSIKTQGHFNLFSAAFDALRVTLDGYFTGDFERAKRGREALNRALDMAGKVKEVVEKFDEMEPNERSAQANEYLEPPKEFHEYDTQRQLLFELEGITTRSQLGGWYARTKEQRDRVTSQKLRNELLDKIRAKRNALEEQESN